MKTIFALCKVSLRKSVVGRLYLLQPVVDRLNLSSLMMSGFLSHYSPSLSFTTWSTKQKNSQKITVIGKLKIFCALKLLSVTQRRSWAKRQFWIYGRFNFSMLFTGISEGRFTWIFLVLL